MYLMIARDASVGAPERDLYSKQECLNYIDDPIN